MTKKYQLLDRQSQSILNTVLFDSDEEALAFQSAQTDYDVQEVVEPEPTAEELAALEAARVALIKKRFDELSGTERVLLKIAFLQENRLRTLEGKQPITVAQFRSWVDGQI